MVLSRGFAYCAPCGHPREGVGAILCGLIYLNRFASFGWIGPVGSGRAEALPQVN